MSNRPQQLVIPFGSLAFANCTSLKPQQIAYKWGCSCNHIKRLIDKGQMGEIDISVNRDKKWSIVPVEEYAAFILNRMSGRGRAEFLRTLPSATLREHANECLAVLKQRGDL